MYPSPSPFLTPCFSDLVNKCRPKYTIVYEVSDGTGTEEPRDRRGEPVLDTEVPVSTIRRVRDPSGGPTRERRPQVTRVDRIGRTRNRWKVTLGERDQLWEKKRGVDRNDWRVVRNGWTRETRVFKKGKKFRVESDEKDVLQKETFDHKGSEHVILMDLPRDFVSTQPRLGIPKPKSSRPHLRLLHIKIVQTSTTTTTTEPLVRNSW